MFNMHPILEKTFLCVCHALTFLDFVADKFIPNLTFVQLFIWFLLTQNKNLHSYKV